ncbi:threonine/serine exporter family protein [Williamsia sterculiae]|uniref:Uncharacterized membrane protein YjjP, DUF1212 family n=1 Tax=Williamsia sterculiae TaxID=1344003 RepID=A0A1N7GZ26_9NOCA|nr:threonine/serine exporter family protein [Williamsia sterculiae]SIS17811.1 Uncharacterized membrane protein YjjP, DUF1212 family [Williamsia sterculiae]
MGEYNGNLTQRLRASTTGLSDKLLGTRRATMDTIDPNASAVSPRQPIDLRDDGAVTEVLDLASKVGSVLLDAGTGAVDTAQQVQFVASVFGVDDVDVDVTYSTIWASAHRGSSLPPVNAMRTVRYRSLDFTRLAQVDRLVRRIRNHAIEPDEAHAVIDLITAAPHPYRRWIATLAWATMAAAISMLLGGGVLMAAVAFVTTAVIDRVNRLLNRVGTPIFFQQLAGGFIAVIPAAVVYRIAESMGHYVSPSQVIAAGITVLLSGLSLVGSVQDAITGAPITGVARFFELIIMTGGIIAGVAIALRVIAASGITLPTISTSTSAEFSDTTVKVIAGGVAAAAFALASYAEGRALAISFVGAAFGVLVVVSIESASGGPVVAAGVGAAVIGLGGGLLARRALTPPQVVAVAAITPLLPGFAIYRGLYGFLNDQTVDGISGLVAATATACALAAGVTLGEFLARTLRRPRIPARPAQVVRLSAKSLMPKRAPVQIYSHYTTVDPSAPTMPMKMRSPNRGPRSSSHGPTAGQKSSAERIE